MSGSHQSQNIFRLMVSKMAIITPDLTIIAAGRFIAMPYSSDINKDKDIPTGRRSCFLT